MIRLVSQEKTGSFERTVCDRNGRFFRVRFVVVEQDGAVRGRIVSVTPVAAIMGETVGPATKPILCLPMCSRSAFLSESATFNPIQSPYVFSFDFFVSQMTRAPSWVS